MTFFDSHLHFDTFHADGRLDDILEKAQSVSVDHMVAIGGTTGC